MFRSWDVERYKRERSFDGPQKKLQVQTRLILNKITDRTFDVMSMKLIALIDETVTTETMLMWVVKKIADVAREQHQVGELYARLCKVIHMEEQLNIRCMMRCYLLRECQDFFDDSLMINAQGMINARTLIGNVKFMGHLVNVGLLDTAMVVSNVIAVLLRYGEDRIPSPLDVDASCQLLQVIGRRLDEEDSRTVDKYIDLLPMLAEWTGEHRIICIVKNLTCLRSKNWVRMGRENHELLSKDGVKDRDSEKAHNGIWF